eukprot:851339-Amphidinium_carterae.1
MHFVGCAYKGERQEKVLPRQLTPWCCTPIPCTPGPPASVQLSQLPWSDGDLRPSPGRSNSDGLETIKGVACD